MDREDLRARQAPLKERCREDPDAAATTVGAAAAFGPAVTADVVTHIGTVRVGLHPATGGDGRDACSTDMLMQALAGCAGVTLHAVAIAAGIDLADVEVLAESEFDARGTLGVDRSVEVGVQRTHVTVIVTTAADDAALARLAAATERYCVVARSLTSPPVFEIRRREDYPPADRP